MMVFRSLLGRVFGSSEVDETPWRDDPEVRPWLHARFLDDAQVVFWEGSWVETMWVRLFAADGGVYVGQLLNQPQHLTTVREGDRVRLRAAGGELYHLPPQVEADLGDYACACQACGFDMLLDPVAQLVEAQFPHLPVGAAVDRFTTRCPGCDAPLVVSRRR